MSSRCPMALRPWRDRAYLVRGVTLGSIPSLCEVVLTETSLSGWGAVWQHRAVSWLWSAKEMAQCINVLERALYLVLRKFLPYLRARYVLIRCDNKSAVHHVNHQGGTRPTQLLQVAWQLLIRAFPYFICRGNRMLWRIFSPAETSFGRMASPPRGNEGNIGQVWYGRGGCLLQNPPHIALSGSH